MEKNDTNILIENAFIKPNTQKTPWMRNFSGINGPNKYFELGLNKEQGEELIEKGWPVKVYIPENNPDEPRYSLKVAIRYDIERFAPDIYLVKDNHKIKYEENELAPLDKLYIESADVILRPRYYIDKFEGKEKIKIYLAKMYIKPLQDLSPEAQALEDKYDQYETITE